MLRFPRPLMFALGALAVAVVCVPAYAQGPGGGGRMGGRMGMMGMRGGGGLNLVAAAANAEVQAKVTPELSQEQKDKIAALAAETPVRGRGPGRDATPEERAAAQKERQAAVDAQVKKLEGIVNEVQFKALKELAASIALQAGPSALADAQVAAVVGVSEASQKKVAALVEAMNAKRQEMMPGRGGDGGGGVDFQAIMEQMQTLQTETNAKIAEVLTKEEKAAVDKIVKLAPDIQLRAGRGQRGQGRQGGRGGAGGGFGGGGGF